MSVLHVDFQDGWTGAPAVIVVDGEVRYRGSPRTRTQIGLAESVDVELSGTAEVSVDAGDGHPVVVYRAPDPAAETWVGVSREPDGGLRVREQQKGFGYF
jgi:hypothetical protein